MIFEIVQTGEQAWISAFNTTPEYVEHPFGAVAEECPEVSVQLVDLDRVPGRRYLTLATVNAAKSFNSRQPIAKTLSMELLLYIAGEKQINEALRRVGITPETHRVAAIAVGDSTNAVLAAAGVLKETLGQDDDDQLLDDWSQLRVENVRSGFDIGAKELKAIVKKGESVHVALDRVAVERSAMLASRR